VQNERSISDQTSHKLITEKYEAISMMLGREKNERVEQEKLGDEAIKLFFQQVIEKIESESRVQE
jgi:hypothetical protein